MNSTGMERSGFLLMIMCVLKFRSYILMRNVGGLKCGVIVWLLIGLFGFCDSLLLVMCLCAMIHVSHQGSREEVVHTRFALSIEIGPEFLTFESVGVKRATVLSDTISKMEGKNSL